ncbi:MAG TPA: hypothetical protein DIT94_09515 [Deltaproteobacteria bacterium]|nr:hypothetical protein [Deltaproteobacteria bacterium]
MFSSWIEKLLCSSFQKKILPKQNSSCIELSHHFSSREQFGGSPSSLEDRSKFLTAQTRWITPGSGEFSRIPCS